MFGFPKREAKHIKKRVSRRIVIDTKRKLRLEKAVLTMKVRKINKALAEIEVILTGGTKEIPAEPIEDIDLWSLVIA
jgi:hypothetical protein